MGHSLVSLVWGIVLDSRLAAVSVLIFMIKVCSLTRREYRFGIGVHRVEVRFTGHLQLSP